MEVAIIVPVVSVISIVTMIIFIRKFTNDERMAMIEKGSDAEMFKNSGVFTPLRFGLLLIGAGLGLLMGSIIDNIFFSYDGEVAYFSMIFIFAGAGLFLSYQMEQKKRDETKE